MFSKKSYTANVIVPLHRLLIGNASHNILVVVIIQDDVILFVIEGHDGQCAHGISVYRALFFVRYHCKAKQVFVPIWHTL